MRSNETHKAENSCVEYILSISTIRVDSIGCVYRQLSLKMLIFFFNFSDSVVRLIRLQIKLV